MELPVIHGPMPSPSMATKSSQLLSRSNSTVSVRKKRLSNKVMLNSPSTLSRSSRSRQYVTTYQYNARCPLDYSQVLPA